MTQERNPILEQENYFAPYQENIKNLQNRPEVIEFDKLCYELFEMNETGKRLLDLMKQRYLMRSLCPRGTATYQLDVLWEKGFKDCILLFVDSLNAHHQRIIAGKNP